MNNYSFFHRPLYGEFLRDNQQPLAASNGVVFFKSS